MDTNRFRSRLTEIDRPEWMASRTFSQIAAAIAAGETEAIDRSLLLAREQTVERAKVYELVLQSYLFVGFPRMLIAASQLDTVWPAETTPEHQTYPVSPEESNRWFTDGLALCRKIYGNAFEPLKEKVERIAPEVFRWMIIEGYGKVLSRNGLSLVDRELGIVATLVIENRKDQLHSHIRGALNAGASAERIATVIDDLGVAAGQGYQTARELLERNGLDR